MFSGFFLCCVLLNFLFLGNIVCMCTNYAVKYLYSESEGFSKELTFLALWTDLIIDSSSGTIKTCMEDSCYPCCLCSVLGCSHLGLYALFVLCCSWLIWPLYALGFVYALCCGGCWVWFKSSIPCTVMGLMILPASNRGFRNWTQHSKGRLTNDVHNKVSQHGLDVPHPSI